MKAKTEKLAKMWLTRDADGRFFLWEYEKPTKDVSGAWHGDLYMDSLALEVYHDEAKQCVDRLPRPGASVQLTAKQRRFVRKTFEWAQ